MDLLDLATFLRLYVVNNLPLTFDVFASFVAFDAFDMLPFAIVHDVSHCDAAA